MTAFTDLRTLLAQARAQKSSADQQIALQRAQLKSVQAQIATLSRQSSGQGAGQEQLAALKKQQDALTAQLGRTVDQATKAETNATQLLGQLVQLDNPANQFAQLNDAIPLLLFPLRLETRFHTSTGRGDAVRQLWIRIYPDDCQIDSFETMLTDVEVQNATAFWIAMWRAGSVEAQERGAWRSFCGGSGSGRAAYVISQFAPTNAVDKPAKVNPQDVVLVIVPQTDVTATEQQKAFDYWTAVWSANGDSGLQQNALQTLQAAVGNARAAELVQLFAPDPNGWDPPTPNTRAEVAVSCAVLKLPPPPVTKQTSWSQAPRMVGQPDRFVAFLYSGAAVKTVIGNAVPEGLETGPDPSLPQSQQIQLTNDDLVLNDDLLWLADFDRAVSVGMGFKIDLTAGEAAAGFDRLLVVGVRMSSDEKTSQQILETLISHQRATPSGYSLVPQGSPTNNTTSDGSAYTWIDDPDAAYDIVFKDQDAYVETPDPLKRRDGEWLAEALGIDDALMKQIPNAANTDQLAARAMNIALWNGTLGYMMEEMMTPLFSAADIAATRLFFTRYVSGRGPLPAARVGRQPYGILPITSFANYRSTPPSSLASRIPSALSSDYLQRLHTLLARMDKDWMTMAGSVARVGQPGDPHQVLLDIVGLNSGSVEYYQRYSESFEQLYNKLVLELGAFFGTLLAALIKDNRTAVLTALGGDPTADPPILDKFFYGANPLLTGPVVDDAPLSESEPIRAYTADNKNYIQWLATASLDAIRRQDFGGKPEPTALLYLMLRHSMMLAQWDAGTRFLEAHALVDSKVARAEPAFVNVQATGGGQSKFQYLYQPQPVITGSPTQTLAEYVLSPVALGIAPETEDLSEIVTALNTIAGDSTARLERTFAEHIDCCSYRLDAWKTGLAAARLAEMRTAGGDSDKRPGIYLGAYGWLENLRPKTTALTNPQLSDDLQKTFARPGDAPLEYDSQNAGYIHAASLNQAAAAAILKNAYRVNATPANPDAMAVNLTSDRVREAQTILEGIRNGQTLSALLGYRFERGLHDEHNLAEVDKFIYPLRLIFPLVANKLKSTADTSVDITLLEARNVIDGVQLVNRMRTPGNAVYPFGIPMGNGPGQVPNASADEAKAINIEAERLLNLYDALADLALAESVYQVVLGNFDRSAAVTTSFSTGDRPPEMQVVETPRTGLSLTHRVAVHFAASVDPAASPNSVPMTPRASAEAPVNAWLDGRLPAPENVTVSVTYSTPVVAPKTVVITQKDLQLQPIDLLYLINIDLDQAMAEIDDRIVQFVRYGPDAHPDIAVTINYTTPGQITFFEVAALVRSLRDIVLKARPVAPTDMAMPLDSKTEDSVWDDAELAGRIQLAITGLTTHRDALVSLEADASDLDGYVQKVSVEMLQTALYGIPQTGTCGIHGDVRGIYDAITAKIQAIVQRWQKRSNDYANLMATLPSLTNDPDRFTLLRRVERLVAASPTANPPADFNVYKTAIDAIKAQFDAHLGQFQGLLTWNGTKVVDFAAAAAAMTPVAAAHDAEPFDVSDQTAAITDLRATIVGKVTALAQDVTQRISDANAALVALSTVSASQDRVQQLLAAAKRVLGSEIQLVPRFQLAAGHATEFNNAWNGSAALLIDLQAAGRRFPVDDWLYGLARVRPKLGAWENVVILGEAFGGAAPELSPVQLPFVAGDRWTALEFDTANATPNDRLLYTAHFAKPFQPAGDQCGLVIDEWPELVPAADMVSGLTFHFDRPNSQPPQTMLLAVPPVLRGNWNWDDLIAMLNQTLDDAKKRGVEPALIDSSNYAQFLPATVMAVTLYQITIATNLGINNRVYDFIGSH